MKRLIGVALVASIHASASFAVADTKSDCLTAYDEAQRDRKDHHLSAAREHLLVCAQAACPAVVKNDCTPWLAEVDQSLPTVILIAQDSGGKDLADVKVFLDGFAFASSLDGTARPVDPGKHVLRFEWQGKVTEETVVLREGEKRRDVKVTFAAPEKPAATPPPVTEPPPAVPEGGGSSKILPIGLGALGVVAIGAGVFFGIQAKSDADDLRSGCAPFCEQSRIDDVKTKLLLSDIGLGVGVVAIAAAAVLLITAPSSPSKTGTLREPLRVRF